MLDLRYNVRRLQSYNESVFFLFQVILLCNGIWVRAWSLKATWAGELSRGILQLSMSIATLEEAIVGAIV